MRVLVDEIEKHTPARPKSPHMNNEEPISFSHFPDGHPPTPPPPEPNGDAAEDEVDKVCFVIYFTKKLQVK